MSITFTTTRIIGAFRFRAFPYIGSAPLVGDGTSGLEGTMAQLEVGSTASSYIPTTSAQVTRAADNVVRTLGDGFNPNEFSFFWEGLSPLDIMGVVANDRKHLFGASNVGGSLEFWNVYFGSSTISFAYTDSVGVPRITVVSSATPNTSYKVVFSFSNSVVKIFINGVLVNTKTDLKSSFNFTEVAIGKQIGATVRQLGGNINNFKIYPKALTDEVCIALTRL